MRLWGYLVLELVGALSIAAAVAFACYVGIGHLNAERAPKAADNPPVAVAPQPQPKPQPLPAPPVPEPAALEPSSTGLFNGVSDEVLLAPLKGGQITEVKYNRGGSSISLRIDFDTGGRAAFKPRQLATQSIPRKEVAAYRLNRLLGLSSVPPAIPVKLKVRDIYKHMRRDSRVFIKRMREEMTVSRRHVIGTASWWIPVIDWAKVGRYRIDTTDGVVTWTRYLTVGQPIPHEDQLLVAQISNMVLFDLLTDNTDRWTGGNARVSGDGRVLYFMDNTLSFSPRKRPNGKVVAYFKKSQKFSRSLVESVRNLRENIIRDAMQRDVEPFKYVLSEREIESLMVRRDYALAYIDGLIEQHGEASVLVFK